jgi:hypothetical protein
MTDRPITIKLPSPARTAVSKLAQRPDGWLQTVKLSAAPADGPSIL